MVKLYLECLALMLNRLFFTLESSWTSAVFMISIILKWFHEHVCKSLYCQLSLQEYFATYHLLGRLDEVLGEVVELGGGEGGGEGEGEEQQGTPLQGGADHS